MRGRRTEPLYFFLSSHSFDSCHFVLLSVLPCILWLFSFDSGLSTSSDICRSSFFVPQHIRNIFMFFSVKAPSVLLGSVHHALPSLSYRPTSCFHFPSFISLLTLSDPILPSPRFLQTPTVNASVGLCSLSGQPGLIVDQHLSSAFQSSHPTYYRSFPLSLQGSPSTPRGTAFQELGLRVPGGTSTYIHTYPAFARLYRIVALWQCICCSAGHSPRRIACAF